MQEEQPAQEPDSSSFSKTLVRVLIVQVIALVLLALLQARYHG